MSFLVFPASPARSATHTAPDGSKYHVKQLPNDAEVFGPVKPVAELPAHLVAIPAPVPAARPVRVPAEISRARFIIAARKRLQLTEGGIFALISQIENKEEQEDARDLFENATSFKRSNKFVNALVAMSGLGDADVDAFFIFAAGLPLD